MGFLALYGYALLAVWVTVSLLWLLSVVLEDASIIDMFWGPLFVLMAWVLLALNLEQANLKMLLAVLLVTIWGLRLAFHLTARNLGQGEDFRYRRWRQRGGSNWWLQTYHRIYLLQGGLALLVATPIIAAFRATPEFLWLNWLGVLLWVAGFTTELLADIQLSRFRADPANEGTVMNQGLWQYSRHPNYFGDALQWWGLGLLCFSGLSWWSLIGPLAMTLLFIYLSNDVLEQGLLKRRPDYARYIQATSAFLPWPPKAATDK